MVLAIPKTVEINMRSNLTRVAFLASVLATYLRLGIRYFARLLVLRAAFVVFLIGAEPYHSLPDYRSSTCYSRFSTQVYPAPMHSTFSGYAVICRPASAALIAVTTSAPALTNRWHRLSFGAEALLIALLGLVYSWITLAVLILGRTGGLGKRWHLGAMIGHDPKGGHLSRIEILPPIHFSRLDDGN